METNQGRIYNFLLMLLIMPINYTYAQRTTDPSHPPTHAFLYRDRVQINRVYFAYISDAWCPDANPNSPIKLVFCQTIYPLQSLLFTRICTRISRPIQKWNLWLRFDLVKPGTELPRLTILLWYKDVYREKSYPGHNNHNNHEHIKFFLEQQA